MQTNLAALMAELEQKQGFCAQQTANAKQALESAKEEESKAAAAARDQIAAALDGGASTGDSLHDSLLRRFGLDQEKIEKFLKFNRAITTGLGVAGNLLMLRVQFSTPRMMRASLVPGRNDIYGEEANDHDGYVLLRLDGNSMSLDKNSRDISITLPATRHAMTGFDPFASGPDKYFSKEGPLTLGEMFNPLNSFALWNFIEHGSPGMNLGDAGNESVAGYSVLVFGPPVTDTEKARIVGRMGITPDDFNGLLRKINE